MSTNAAEYAPPESRSQLVLAWLRRARESQFAHYEMAERLGKRHFCIGVPVIILSVAVGTSAFASVLSEILPTWSKVLAGSASVVAAILAALQTFFKFSERAERHRTFAAKYGALRRELEVLHVSKGLDEDVAQLRSLRERLDRLAEEAPSVPDAVFKPIQTREVAI